jgi:hypothetical protein
MMKRGWEVLAKDDLVPAMVSVSVESDGVRSDMAPARPGELD